MTLTQVARIMAVRHVKRLPVVDDVSATNPAPAPERIRDPTGGRVH